MADETDAGASFFRQLLVCGQRREPFVLDGATHREVVGRLCQSRRRDPGTHRERDRRSNSRSRSNGCPPLQPRDSSTWPTRPASPEKISIERSAVGHQAARVVCDHPEAEGAIPGDVLAAGNARSFLSAAVPFLEQVQRESTRGMSKVTSPQELNGASLDAVPRPSPGRGRARRDRGEYRSRGGRRGPRGGFAGARGWRAPRAPIDRPGWAQDERASGRTSPRVSPWTLSMLTALRRPRITLSAVNAPDRERAARRVLSSEGNLENPSSATILGLAVANEPRSGASPANRTPCSGLSALAVPDHWKGVPVDSSSFDRARPRSLPPFSPGPRAQRGPDALCSAPA